MIVPMKKVSVITQSKDAEVSVKALRGLGVLHVEHQIAPKGVDISELGADISLVTNASMVLSGPEFAGRIPLENGRHIRDWKSAANHIVNLWKRIDQLAEYSRVVAASIKEWEMWGDFSPEAVGELEKKDIYVKLYEIPSKKLNELPKDIVVKKIFTSRGVAGCAIISRRSIELPFKEKVLPKTSLKEMKARLAEDTKAVQIVKANIVRHLRYRETFGRIKAALEKELEFHLVWRGMGEAGSLSYLSGYVPVDAASALEDAARKEKWGLLVKNPSEDDAVPTLVRNPRWISIIEPVFRMIEIVPGYHELDISLWFLVFFSIFFGMLIGDAGIGMIFIIMTFLAQLKYGKSGRNRPMFTLFYILSACAVVWGALTGTFFGQEWLPASVKPLIPALRNDRNLQELCFFLGALHLSLGHIWRAAQKLPSVKALADIGWALVLWGAFFLAKSLILGGVLPGFVMWLFIVGPVLVVLFTSPSKNILKGIAGGFGHLLLNIVNSFTDVVSYVRLFAVGLATVAIADSFNKMAMDIGFGSFASGVLTALIILIGQALNIMLGPLSVLVHGVRLNVLEFCNHVDIKWSGFSYRPLRESAALPK